MTAQPERTRRTILAYDIGGTTASAALVCDGALVGEPIERPLSADADLATVAGELRALGDAVLAAAVGATVEGVAVAAPAPCHYASGTSWMEHKLVALRGRSYFELLGRADVPIVAINDADAFCLGEVAAGAAREARRTLAITLGTGIGSAFAVDGALVHEGPGVPPDGALWCTPFAGAVGHTVEDEVGRDALLARYRRVAGREVGSVAEIASRAHDGEDEARALFEHLGRALALAIAASVREFAPDRVVLGGGISRGAPLFLPALEAQLDEVLDARPPVVTAELGARAALIGAAEALEQRLARFGRRRVIYLHGFASSPGSYKAQRFAEAFAARGVDVEIPDLNEGDFRGLTMTRQLELLRRLTAGAAPGSLLLIGSSFGGYASALFAAESDAVAACVLMCPAFDFVRRWSSRFGADEMARWRDAGALTLMHFGSGAEEQVGWGLIEDAERHVAFPDVQVPVRIYHGTRDEDVPMELSQTFAAERPNVDLTLLDSDHGLGDVVDRIVAESFELLERLWA